VKPFSNELNGVKQLKNNIAGPLDFLALRYRFKGGIFLIHE